MSENLKRETDLQKYTADDVNQCYCTSSLEAEGQKCVFKQLIMRIAHTRTHKQWRNDFLGERDCV